jgi:hypothetical protein
MPECPNVSALETAICAVISVLWICYPRYRVLYGICMAAVASASSVPTSTFLEM